MRIVNYLGMTGYWLLRFGSPLVLLALPGAAYAWRNRRILTPALWPALLLFVLEMIFLVFVAGKEFATANRFAAIPLSIVLIFTALGADRLIARFEQFTSSFWIRIKSRPALNVLTFAFCSLLLIYGSQPVARANAAEEFRAPYEVAQFLQAKLQKYERALIVAESIDGAVPMPYQRVFGQLAFEKSRLLCAALLESDAARDPLQLMRQLQVRYLVVFGGNWPKGAHDLAFLQLIASRPSGVMKAFENSAAIVYDCAGVFSGTLSNVPR